MDNTAPCSTFSTRSNARRAAEKMITAGTAPAVDYGIKPRDDGRFEIVWKTGNGTPATTGEIETEITTATAAESSAATSEPALPAAPAATEAAEAAAGRSSLRRKLKRHRSPPPLRRLRIFGQQDKLRADRSKGRETWA